jgi:hypothetical protein
VYGIALVLFYYDQRIRQEGFDIEWMMLQAGMVAPPAAPQPEAAPWTAAVAPVHQPAEPSAPSVVTEATPEEPVMGTREEAPSALPPDPEPGAPA